MHLLAVAGRRPRPGTGAAYSRSARRAPAAPVEAGFLHYIKGLKTSQASAGEAEACVQGRWNAGALRGIAVQDKHDHAIDRGLSTRIGRAHELSTGKFRESGEMIADTSQCGERPWRKLMACRAPACCRPTDRAARH